MKLLKLILMMVLLLSVTMFAGCEAGYARRPEGELRKVYRLRADGLHIPNHTYSQ